MANVELASAYVSILPSTKGFMGKLQGELGDAGSRAGDSASKGFGAKFVGGMKGTAVLAGGLLAGAFVGFGFAAKLGAEFDSAYDAIRVGTGATGEALDALKGDFKEVFSSVPTDMESASTAIADLNTRLGLTGEPLQQLSTQFLELSRLTGTDLGTNIETVTRVFGDWGVETENQSDKLDALFRASQATGPSVDRISQLMVQYGAPLRQLGFDFDETAALLGKFEKEGVNTELVMGSMRVALGKMAREGEPAQETLQRVTDEIANAGSASEANALALELFGARAGPDMAAAIREGRFEVGALLDTVGSGEETILGAAADTADFGEKFQVLKNKVLVGLEPILTKVFDALGRGMDALVPIIEDAIPKFESGLQKLSAWWQQNGPQIIDTATRIVRTITEGFGSVKSWVDTNWPQIQAVITGAIETVQSVIEGVVSVVTVVWENFGNNILEFAMRVWGPLQQIVKSAMDIIQGVIKTITSLIKGDWSNVWEGIKQVFHGVWNAIQGIVKAALEAVRFVIGVALEIIGSVLKSAWEGIQKGVTKAWDAFTKVITDAWDGITGFLSLMLQWVVDQITGMPDKITSAASGLFDGIRDAFRAAINWIIDKWNDLSFTMPKAEFLGQSIGGWTLDTPDLPRLPEFHNGGIVPGSSGSEMAAMLQAGEMVLTREQQQAMLGATFNINADGLTGAEAAQYVPRAIMHHQMLQGVN